MRALAHALMKSGSGEMVTPFWPYFRDGEAEWNQDQQNKQKYKLSQEEIDSKLAAAKVKHIEAMKAEKRKRGKT